ncbi:unnamed protein product, partial [Scytosiphon promiscuus]
MWAPYRATGLKLTISVKISPDTIGGGDGCGVSDGTPVAKANEPAAPSPASSPLPERRVDSEAALRASQLDGAVLASAKMTKDDDRARRPNSFPRRKRTVDKGRQDKEDSNVGTGFFRNYRHKRANSDVPLLPRQGAIGAELLEPGIGCGRRASSGLLADTLLRRSGAARDRLPDVVQTGQSEGVENSRGESAGGVEMNADQSVSSSDYGRYEVHGGRSGGDRGHNRITVGGRDGEREREGSGGRESGGTRGASGDPGREDSRVPPPLITSPEGNNDLADSLPRMVRILSTTALTRKTLNGPTSCPPRPCDTPRGRTARRPKEEHVFGQGFWIALRLDLLRWFMPLSTATTSDFDPDLSRTREGECTPDDKPRGTAWLPTSTGSRKTNSGAEISDGVTPEHVSISSIVKSVSASADVRRLALATWRGDENRDGFVLDINRLVCRPLVASTTGFPPSFVRALLPNHRGSRFDDGEEREKRPPSPPESGGRRLSRLWIGLRQSSRGLKGAPCSPATENPGEVSQTLRDKVASPAVVRSGSAGADVEWTASGGDGAQPPNSLEKGKREASRGQLPAGADVDATALDKTAVEGRQHQLKAVSSFFGSSVGRIRSATKLVSPSSKEQTRGSDKSLAEATAAVAASAGLAVGTTPARSPRRGFMKNVGLPRRRASSASPTARSPADASSPPPFAHRQPSLPPRVVTATRDNEELVPSGCDGAKPSPQDTDAGVEKTTGATNLVVLDGLRLVWNLEIRDSVVMFVSDAMESFSAESCPSKPGEESGDAPLLEGSPEDTRTRAPGHLSPGNCKPNTNPGESTSPSPLAAGNRRTFSFISPPLHGQKGHCGDDDDAGRRGSDGHESGRRASAPGKNSSHFDTVRRKVGGGIGGTDDGEDGRDKGVVDVQHQSGPRVNPIAASGGCRSGAVNVAVDTGSGEAGGGGGEDKTSSSPHGLNLAPSRIDTDGLDGAKSSKRSPSALISPGTSSAGSDVSSTASPATGEIPTSTGQGGGNDPNGLLDWMIEKLKQKPEQNPDGEQDHDSQEDEGRSSSGQTAAAATTAASASATAAAQSWPACPVGTPRGKGPSPSPSPKSTSFQGSPGSIGRRSNSPKAESTKEGALGGDSSIGGGRGGPSGKHGGRGMLGKRHIDYEVHLKNPQIKLLGDSACLILYAEGADVEAGTCGTWEMVAPSPTSDRASTLRSSQSLSPLQRKEVKVKLERARVFSLTPLDEGVDRWVVHPSAASESLPYETPGTAARTRSWEPKPAPGALLRSPTSSSRGRGQSPSSSPMSPSTSPTAAAVTEENNLVEGSTPLLPLSPPSHVVTTAAASTERSMSPPARDNTTDATRKRSLASNAEDASDVDDAWGGPPPSPSTGPASGVPSLSPPRFFKAPSRSKFVSGFGGGGVGGHEGDKRDSKHVLKKGASWFGRRGYDDGRRGSDDPGGTDHHDVKATEQAEQDELREVMRPFSANALYVYHETLPGRKSDERIRRASRQSAEKKHTKHAGNGTGGYGDGGGIDGGRDDVGFKKVDRPPVNKLRLDVPELSSDLDSSQFFEVLDVVKNLLLVPPPLELRDKVLERKRQRRAANCLDSEKARTIVAGEAVNLATEGKGGGLNINIRDKRRDHLKEVVEETLKSWNIKKLSSGSTAVPAFPPTSSSGTQAWPVASETEARTGSAAAAPSTTDRSCYATPPCVRTGDGGRPVAMAAGSKPRELTRLEYRIGRCTWRLTMGTKTDHKDTVDRDTGQTEVGLTGLSATHNYTAEGGPGSGVVIENVMFQIERLWVRSLAPATAARGGRRGGTKSGNTKTGKRELGTISSRQNSSQSKPSSPTSSSSVAAPSPPASPPGSTTGPSHTGTPNAAGDRREEGGNDRRTRRTSYSSRSMLSPTLLYDLDNPCTTSACTSCKQNFVPEENAWNSCRFHCDADGEDGVFVFDGVGRPAGLRRPAAGRIGRWSCCGSEDSSAIGCTPRPHKPKEIMISVRAEGAPSVLVGNTEVSVFKHLEVNIFPSIPYNLSINIRREEAAALQHYFKLEAETEKEKDQAGSKKGGRHKFRLPSRKTSPKATSNISSSLTNSTRGGRKRGSTAVKSIAQPMTAIEGAGDGVGDGTSAVPTLLERQASDERRALLLLLGKRAAGSAASPSPSPSPSSSHVASASAPAVAASARDDPVGKETDEGDPQDHENVVYLKYVRFGAVRLVVSTTGYKFIRLSDFPVLVNPYVRHGKMTDWKRLTNKCVWRMVRHTTRSGLSQLKHAGVFGRISGGGANIVRELLPARPGHQRPSASDSSNRRDVVGTEGGGTSRGTSPKNRARRFSQEVEKRRGGAGAAGSQSSSSEETVGDSQGNVEEDSVDRQERIGVGHEEATTRAGSRKSIGFKKSSARGVGIPAVGGNEAGGRGGGEAKLIACEPGVGGHGAGQGRRGDRGGNEEKGGNKKMSVATRFRRRLRSGTRSHADVVSAAATIVAAVAEEMPVSPVKENVVGGDSAKYSTGVGDGGRVCVETRGRKASDPSEGAGVLEGSDKSASHSHRGHNRGPFSPSSSLSSSSSRSATFLEFSLLHLQTPPPHDAATQIPVGIEIGRRQ